MVYTTPKVCLFLGRHETSASGLWTYGRNIAQGLLEAECDWDFDLICLFAGPLELEKDLLKLRKNSTRKRELYLQKLPDYFPSRRLNMLSDIILMRIESDIIHGTANLLPLFNKSVKFLTLHDLLQAFPLKSNLSRYETIRKYLYQLLLKQMISREVRIFTDRSAVQHDILKHLGTTNISVLYPPLSKEFVSKESGPITKTDSFVCFISQDRRKNIKALISALGSVNSSFVLKIFASDHKSKEKAEELLRSANNQFSWEIIEKAPLETLISEIGKARALLYPSRSEGFGYPIYEALALGTPVVCQEKSIINEFTPFIGSMIFECDATSVESITKAIQEVETFKTPPEIREQVRLKCREILSIDSAAQKLIQIYKNSWKQD